MDIQYILRKLPQSFAIGLLLAIGFSLLPSAYCALADCGVKDKWCNPDCSQTCGSTTGVNYVTGCVRRPSYCQELVVVDYKRCWCSNASNCECTDGSSNFPYWDVRGCMVSGAGCATYSNVDYITCCAGAGSGGTCTPNYAPPTISTTGVTLSPAHPLVLGQDPDRLGVTVSGITATGGTDSKCGEPQQKIKSLTVSIRLSDATIAWITGPLAQRYPGASIKGSYPILPTLNTTGLDTITAATSFHFDPLDPGTYNVTITATQGNGQSATAVLPVPAYLLDSTITIPER